MLFRLMSRSRVNALLLIAILAGCSGCGGGITDNRKGLAPVTGKVTLDGKPLTTGTISFVAMDGSEAFTGPIDSSGNYTLASSPSSPGALPGEYKVIIIASQQATMGDPMKGGQPIAAEAKTIVPEKYTKPDSSGLTGSVKSGSNTINFDLKSS
jgi:hypothetical protein